LANLKACAAILFSADLLRPQTELPGKLGRASTIYKNKISLGKPHNQDIKHLNLTLISIDCINITLANIGERYALPKR
jgi:hypothetical protein